MLLKILIVGGGLYFLYRRFISNFQIEGRQEDQGNIDQYEDNDDEYIDYEEVD